MVRTKELIKNRESCTHRTITCGLCEAFSELKMERRSKERDNRGGLKKARDLEIGALRDSSASMALFFIPLRFVN